MVTESRFPAGRAVALTRTEPTIKRCSQGKLAERRKQVATRSRRPARLRAKPSAAASRRKPWAGPDPTRMARGDFAETQTTATSTVERHHAAALAHGGAHAGAAWRQCPTLSRRLGVGSGRSDRRTRRPSPARSRLALLLDLESAYMPVQLRFRVGAAEPLGPASGRR
jgi:hypothetical protein